jgi:hypothetical protein
MTADELETLGLLVDKLDNGVAATVLPLPPNIHVTGMKGIMTEARDELRAFLVGKGFNPWSDQ